MKSILGIDIAKDKFDVSLLANGKYTAKQYKNNVDGTARRKQNRRGSQYN